MEFKNAVNICLISFFSAALVVLIARSLDLQVASEIRPELEQISRELQALRAQLAGQPVGDATNTATDVRDGVIVYYAHGKDRCPTCRNLERQAHEAIQSGFSEELKKKKVAWQVRNYDKPEGTFLKDDYNVFAPTVVLVRMKDGKVVGGKNLVESFGLITQGMNEKFTEYLQNEVRAMLGAEKSPETPPENPENSGATSEIPLPTP